MVKKIKKITKNKLVNKQTQKQTVNIHIGNKGKKSSGSYRKSQPKSEQQVSHYQSGFTPVYIQSGNPNHQDFNPLVEAVSELRNTIKNQPVAHQPVSVRQPVSHLPMETSIQTEPNNKPPKYDRNKNSDFLSGLQNDKFEEINPLLNPKKVDNNTTPLFTRPEKADVSTPLTKQTPRPVLPPLPPAILFTPVGNRLRYMDDLETRREVLRKEFLQLGGSESELESMKNNQNKLKKAIRDMQKRK
jgi:hypothetical protein